MEDGQGITVRDRRNWGSNYPMSAGAPLLDRVKNLKQLVGFGLFLLAADPHSPNQLCLLTLEFCLELIERRHAATASIDVVAAKKYASLVATKLWVRYPEMPVEDPEQLTADQIRSLTA